MSEDTFGLTTVTEKSRYIFPSLASPPSFSLQKSTSSARLSEESSPRVHKSLSTLIRVSDRLKEVQASVKRSFDTLYSTKKTMLLSKAMELERSESVKDQMKTLEGHVVSLSKTYNALLNQRRSKESLLSRLTKEFEQLSNSEPDLAPIKNTVEDVKRRFEFAQRQIDREVDYSETLAHMVTEMHKNIARKVQPIYCLRRDLQQLKLRFHENEGDFLRIALESQSLWNMIHKSEEELKLQVSRHQTRVQEKVTHCRRRAEFVEFVNRQSDQKALEARIQENERDVHRMESSKRAMEHIEQMLESSKSHLEALQTYERDLEVLSRAAHTGSIQQVVEYWQYLQDFGSSLTVRVDQSAERVAGLRREFKLLVGERTAVRLCLSPEAQVSAEDLERMQKQLNKKVKEVADLNNKLQVWQQAVASIRSRLEGIWTLLGGELIEMTPAELLRRVEEELVVKLDSRE